MFDGTRQQGLHGSRVIQTNLCLTQTRTPSNSQYLRNTEPVFYIQILTVSCTWNLILLIQVHFHFILNKE